MCADFRKWNRVAPKPKPQRYVKTKEHKLPEIKDVNCCKKECLQKELSQEDLLILRNDFQSLPNCRSVTNDRTCLFQATVLRCVFMSPYFCAGKKRSIWLSSWILIRRSSVSMASTWHMRPWEPFLVHPTPWLPTSRAQIITKLGAPVGTLPVITQVSLCISNCRVHNSYSKALVI